MAQPVIRLNVQLNNPNNIGAVNQFIKRNIQPVNVPVRINVTGAGGAKATLANVNALNKSLNQLNSTAGSSSAAFSRAFRDVDNFGKAIQRQDRGIVNIKNQLKALDKQTATTSQRFKAFADQVAVASNRYAAFIVSSTAIVGILASIGDGVNQAIKFQKEMIRFQQVGSDSISTLQRVSKEIRGLSKDFGASSLELARTAVTLRQAGFAAEDVRKSLDALAKTTLAPNFDRLEDTVEGLIAINSQFQISIGKSEKALSQINAVAGAFAVEASDLITGVQKLGGAFSAAGGSFEELLGIITAVRSTTRESADTIATGLRTILARTQRTTVIEDLKALGVNLRANSEEAKRYGIQVGAILPVFARFQKLAAAAGQLPQGDPRLAQIVELTGGIRQLSKTIPILQQFNKATDATNLALRSTNTLTKDATLAQKSMQDQLRQLRESVLDLFGTIGENKALKDFVNLFIQGTKALNDFSKAAEPLIPIIGALAFRGAFGLGRNVLGRIGGGNIPITARTETGFGGSGVTIRRNRGGIVPGPNVNADIINADLDPGSFVLRREVADKVLGFNKGGKVPAKLTPREIVVPQTIAQQIGYGKLELANKTKKITPEVRQRLLGYLEKLSQNPSKDMRVALKHNFIAAHGNPELLRGFNRGGRVRLNRGTGGPIPADVLSVLGILASQANDERDSVGQVSKETQATIQRTLNEYSTQYPNIRKVYQQAYAKNITADSGERVANLRRGSSQSQAIRASAAEFSLRGLGSSKVGPNRSTISALQDTDVATATSVFRDTSGAAPNPIRIRRAIDQVLLESNPERFFTTLGGITGRRVPDLFKELTDAEAQARAAGNRNTFFSGFFRTNSKDAAGNVSRPNVDAPTSPITSTRAFFANNRTINPQQRLAFLRRFLDIPGENYQVPVGASTFGTNNFFPQQIDALRNQLPKKLPRGLNQNILLRLLATGGAIQGAEGDVRDIPQSYLRGLSDFRKLAGSRGGIRGLDPRRTSQILRSVGLNVDAGSLPPLPDQPFTGKETERILTQLAQRQGLFRASERFEKTVNPLPAVQGASFSPLGDPFSLAPFAPNTPRKQFLGSNIVQRGGPTRPIAFSRAERETPASQNFNFLPGAPIPGSLNGLNAPRFASPTPLNQGGLGRSFNFVQQKKTDDLIKNLDKVATVVDDSNKIAEAARRRPAPFIGPGRPPFEPITPFFYPDGTFTSPVNARRRPGAVNLRGGNPSRLDFPLFPQLGSARPTPVSLSGGGARRPPRGSLVASGFGDFNLPTGPRYSGPIPIIQSARAPSPVPLLNSATVGGQPRVLNPNLILGVDYDPEEVRRSRNRAVAQRLTNQSLAPVLNNQRILGQGDKFKDLFNNPLIQQLGLTKPSELVNLGKRFDYIPPQVAFGGSAQAFKNLNNSPLSDIPTAIYAQNILNAAQKELDARRIGQENLVSSGQLIGSAQNIRAGTAARATQRISGDIGIARRGIFLGDLDGAFSSLSPQQQEKYLNSLDTFDSSLRTKRGILFDGSRDNLGQVSRSGRVGVRFSGAGRINRFVDELRATGTSQFQKLAQNIVDASRVKNASSLTPQEIANTSLEQINKFVTQQYQNNPEFARFLKESQENEAKRFLRGDQQRVRRQIGAVAEAAGINPRGFDFTSPGAGVGGANSARPDFVVDTRGRVRRNAISGQLQGPALRGGRLNDIRRPEDFVQAQLRERVRQRLVRNQGAFTRIGLGLGFNQQLRRQLEAQATTATTSLIGQNLGVANAGARGDQNAPGGFTNLLSGLFGSGINRSSSITRATIRNLSDQSGGAIAGLATGGDRVLNRFGSILGNQRLAGLDQETRARLLLRRAQRQGLGVGNIADLETLVGGAQNFRTSTGQNGPQRFRQLRNFAGAINRNPFVNRLGGTLANPAAAIGLGFAASAIAPREINRDNTFAAGASGLLQGVGTGALVGSVGGAPGAIIGGVIGGFVGVTRSLKEFDKQIQDIEFGRTFDSLLNRITRDLNRDDGTINAGDIASFVSETERQARTQFTDAGARQDFLTQRFGAAGEQLQRIVQQIAASDEISGGNANERLQSFLSFRGGVGADVTRAFAAANSQTIAETQNVISEIIKQTQTTKRANEALEELTVDANRLENLFDNLADSVNVATIRYQSNAETLGAFSLSLGANNLPGVGLSRGINAFGVRGAEDLFGRSARFFSSLGENEGVGTRLNEINRAAIELPNILRELSQNPALDPELIQNRFSRLLSQSGIDGDVARSLRAALESLEENIQEDIRNPQQLSRDIISGAFPIFERLPQVFEQVEQNLRSFGDALERGREITLRGREFRSRGIGLRDDLLRQGIQFGGLAGGGFAGGSQFQSTRFQRRLAASPLFRRLGIRPFPTSFSGGDPSLALPLSQLNQPFVQQQALLGGAANGRLFSPDQINQQLQSVLSQIDEQQNILNSSSDPAALNDAQNSLRTLQDTAFDLQGALSNLADTSLSAAAAQEKLAAIERERSGRLSFAERFIQANPFERAQIAGSVNQAAFAVRNNIGLDQFNPLAQSNILNTLRSIGDIQTGFGETGNQLADQLIQRSSIGNFANNLLGGPSFGQLEVGRQQAQGAILQASENAIRATDLLAQNAEQERVKFFDQLRQNQEAFLRDLAISQKDSERDAQRQRIADIEISRDPQRQAIRAGRNLSRLGLDPDQIFKIFRENRPEVTNLLEARQDFIQRRSNLGNVGRILNNVERFSRDADIEIGVRRALTNVSGFGGDINAISERVTRELENLSIIGGPVDTRGTVNRIIAESLQEDAVQARANLLNEQDIFRRETGLDLRSTNAISNLDDEQVSKIQDFVNEVSKTGGTFQSLQDNFNSYGKQIENLNTSISELNQSILKTAGVDLNQAKGIVDVQKDIANLFPSAIGFASGGSVFKPRGTDTVPAMLTPGEFIVNAKSASKHRNLLETINAQYMNRGGFAGFGTSFPEDEELAQRIALQSQLASFRIRRREANREALQAAQSNSISRPAFNQSISDIASASRNARFAQNAQVREQFGLRGFDPAGPPQLNAAQQRTLEARQARQRIARQRYNNSRDPNRGFEGIVDPNLLPTHRGPSAQQGNPEAPTRAMNELATAMNQFSQNTQVQQLVNLADVMREHSEQLRLFSEAIRNVKIEVVGNQTINVNHNGIELAKTILEVARQEIIDTAIATIDKKMRNRDVDAVV